MTAVEATGLSKTYGRAVRGLLEDPLRATYLGDHRFDDRWPDLSAAALEKAHAGDVAVLDTNLVEVGRSAPARLLQAKVRYTIAGGKIVYSR